MLVDIDRSTPIGRHDFPSLPKSGSNVVRRYRAGRVEISFLHLPQTVSGEDLAYIHYALLAHVDGDLMCAVSVESLDLRALASSIGASVKEVQKDYGTKGFYSTPSLVIYGDGEREDLGPLPVELKEEFVLPYMMDYLLDSMDLAEDPVPLS